MEYVLIFILLLWIYGGVKIEYKKIENNSNIESYKKDETGLIEENNQLKKEIEKKDRTINKLIDKKASKEMEAENDKLNGLLITKNETISSLNDLIASKDSRIKSLNEELKLKESEINRYIKLLNEKGE